MKKAPKQDQGLLGLIFFGLLFIVFSITYVKQRSLRFPSSNNPNRINDTIIDTCKRENTKVKNCQKRFTVIILNPDPHRLRVCRYLFRKM